MPVELSIEGQGLRDLKRKMKALDRKDLNRALNKGLREGAKPAADRVPDAARRGLPQRGGLAERIASKKARVSVTQTGVRIVVKGTDAKATDKGVLRHPVFAREGAPRTWVIQQIKPGWFTDEMRRAAPIVRPRIRAALDDFAEKVAKA